MQKFIVAVVASLSLMLYAPGDSPTGGDTTVEHNPAAGLTIHPVGYVVATPQMVPGGTPVGDIPVAPGAPRRTRSSRRRFFNPDPSDPVVRRLDF